LQWKNADLLEAAITIAGRETVLNTVEIPGQPPVTLPPVCLPYSPEFAPDQPGRGAAALAQIAATSGGKDRVEIPKIWGELPVKSRYVELAPWLFVASAILFLLEVFERRTGWVSGFLGRKAVAPAPETAVAAVISAAPKRPGLPWLIRKPAPAPGRSKAVGKAASMPAGPAEPESAPAQPASPETAIDALRKARERARNRTEKER
jgi:hypothetical protein